MKPILRLGWTIYTQQKSHLRGQRRLSRQQLGLEQGEWALFESNQAHPTTLLTVL
jgi:hypothetical protein